MPLNRLNQLRLLSRGNSAPTLTQDMVARNRRPPRSTEVRTSNAVQKVSHSAKLQQAWKYPGGIIQRAPSKYLGGKEYTDPKNQALARRKQESNFFITLNTNLGPQAEAEKTACVDALKAALLDLADARTLNACLKYGPYDDHYANDKYEDVIASINFQSAVEIGENLGRVHAHIWLTIVHYSQLQLNIKLIQHRVKAWYNNSLVAQYRMKPAQGGLQLTKMPYIHIKLLPQADWADIMRNYVTKNFASETGYASVTRSS